MAWIFQTGIDVAIVSGTPNWHRSPKLEMALIFQIGIGITD